MHERGLLCIGTCSVISNRSNFNNIILPCQEAPGAILPPITPLSAAARCDPLCPVCLQESMLQRSHALTRSASTAEAASTGDEQEVEARAYWARVLKEVGV